MKKHPTLAIGRPGIFLFLLLLLILGVSCSQPPSSWLHSLWLTESDEASYNILMATLSRRQRDLQKREELIVEATRDLLLNKGYHGLTMDRIAGAIEYSKGTIYQHFSCKEEVLAEMAIRLFEKRLTMFERAATFQGRTRERMVAIGEAGELFVRLYPDDLRILQIIKTEIIDQKISEARLVRMRTSEYRVLTSIMVGIVRDAIAQGDLVLPPETVVEQLPFGLWAITDGGYATILRDVPLQEVGIRDPFVAVIRTCEVLGDGYGWHPLSSEWDYAQTRRRVRETIFAEEYQQLILEKRN
jgi:AcrR family transcriptional regulator